MRGFPKYINSKQDVLNLLVEYPSETKQYLQELLDTKDVWLNVGKLKSGEDGVTDATHKVVETKDQETGEVKERYQYEFKEDPNGTIYRLGFTPDEVRKLV